ncbi:hypothetical protein [Pedobacter jejuensis]|nr:hypothetical protein [Pedobacter jejuensis]
MEKLEISKINILPFYRCIACTTRFAEFISASFLQINLEINSG